MLTAEFTEEREGQAMDADTAIVELVSVRLGGDPVSFPAARGCCRWLRERAAE